MTPSRQRGKPVFDPAALDDDLDELWPQPAVTASSVSTRAAAVSPAPSAPPSVEGASPTPLKSGGSQDGTATARSTAARTSGAPRRLAAAQPAPRRFRPPEVSLSSEVYDELYRVQNAERKIRRGLARSMGTIVLDAIEAHAARLEQAWQVAPYAVGEGQIFERPSSMAVPRRRRHATAPRTVVLSGVTASNAALLDSLVQRWNAGTRSALVEQALRYEFALVPGSST